MRLLGRAVAAFALLGATAAAWGQGLTSDSPTVSGGWQSVASAGAVGGSYFVAKNRLSSTSETASWSLQAPSTGDYQIQVYIPPADNQGLRTKNATYVINRGLGTTLRDRIDQTLSGWQTIGTFKLAKGTISVTLINRTAEPEGSHVVVADAVRLQTGGTSSGYSAALASSDLSRTATAGDVVTFDVQLTNTGTQTWYRDPAGKGQVPVRLALIQGPGPLCANIPAWEPGFGWLPRSRDRVLMDTAQVAQGQTGSFLFSIQLAQNLPPGVYVYRFRPIAESTGGTGGEVMSPEIVLSIGVAAKPQNELDFSALNLYRANLSVHTSNSDGDKLIGKNFPDDRSPLGALTYARTQKLVNVLGLTDHGEELSPAEWAGQAAATAAQTTTTVGNPFFVGLRGFKWSATTGPHDFFGFPWEGSPNDLGHLSIYGTSTWTGTAAHKDGMPPQLTPLFIDTPNSDITLSGGPTSLADWLWVFGYPRPNTLDNGVSPAQFNHPSLFFRSNFFRQYQYEADMDRFFPLMAVGTGEFAAGYATDPNVQKDLANQISDKGGYRFLGPDDRPDDDNDTPNVPPKELRSLSADLLAAIGHPEDPTKWGTNPNNTNRFWFETALRKGWHVGPTINGDNHAGCYCDDAGYTGIWAKTVTGQTPEQAQSTVLQALRERAVFASEDRGLSAQFSVFSNGTQYRMGQRNVPLTSAPRFVLDLASVAVGGNPADVNVKAIYLVTNSGETQISGPRTGATMHLEATVPVALTAVDQELFFYARVVQNDNDQLLTAPIWMTSCCPPPTCSLFQTSGTVGTGGCAIVGFSSQNGTSATLQIDGGTPFSVPLAGTRVIQTSEVSTTTSVHTLIYRVIGACGSSVCSLQITCGGGPPPVQCAGSCTITASPATGDSTTNFTATWTSSDTFGTRLLVDGVDLGPVPAAGSRVLGQFACGPHTVALSRTCGGVPAEGCQSTFQVISNTQPGCRMSVLPPGGVQATVFDICFFASGATQVQVFVDGVLRCTQINPVAGTQYNCLVSGTTLTPGFHTAMIIASDNCGGTCQRQMSFQVFAGSPVTGKGETATLGQAQLAPSAFLTAGTLNFGNQNTGSTSAPQSFILSNNGTAPLVISSIGIGGSNPGDFAIVAGSGPGTLDPGQSRTISITFAPKALGSRSASVIISTNAVGTPSTVTLLGTGTSPVALAPAVQLSTTSLSFGNQDVNTTSAGQSFTLTNSGTAPLSIINVTFNGLNQGDFHFTAGDSSGTLLPGQSRTITVVFKPTATGARSARADIISNASTSPNSVALSGTGTSAVPLAPAVQLSTTSLSFGNQAKGTTSAVQSFTFTNTGTAPLSIINVTFNGVNQGDFHFTGGDNSGTLMPGQSRTVTVVFQPTDFGARSARADIITNASSSPDSVMLSGTGT